MLLSRHAGHVIATDVNARALAFAAFNFALNGVANVELREGSLLEPVLGERFGCVACNPPYVVSPDAVFTFRDSGLPGDRVSELLARGLTGVLEPGGFATLMASWAQTGDAPGARPREWLDGAGCDSWILHRPPTTRSRTPPPGRVKQSTGRGVRRHARPLDGVLPRARNRGTRVRRARAATP